MTQDVEARRRRLAETIAWCALQKLESKPAESDDVKRRRALGAQAVNLAFAAHQLEASSPFKWVSRSKVSSMRKEAELLLAEAQLDSIRPLADQLRTPALKRAKFELSQTDEARAAIVEAVCEARAVQMREYGKPIADSSAIDIGGGRILRFKYRGTIADRSPGYESKGFFDNECAPPWETWVCYTSGGLVAYVPRILCGLAQLGIEVDPAESIRWADSQFLAQTFAL